MEETKTPEAGGQQALVPASSLKPPACVAKPFDDIEKAGQEAITRLRALADDAALAPETRKAVSAMLARVNPNKKGLDADVQADLQLPEIVINQPTTELGGGKPDTAKNGDLLAVVGRKVVTAVLPHPFKFHVLLEYQSNAKFVEGEKAPVCTSPDAKLGNPQGECEKCPDLPMGRQPGGWGDQKPTECNFSLCYVVVDEKFENIYDIKFSKTSLKGGRAVSTLIRASDGGVWVPQISVDTEKQTNDKGTFFTLKIASTGVKLDGEHDKVCDALYDIVNSAREKLLHRYYNAVLNAKVTAKAVEASFDRTGLAAGTGAGEEPELGEEPKKDEKKAESKTAPKGGAARKSSTPM